MFRIVGRCLITSLDITWLKDKSLAYLYNLPGLNRQQDINPPKKRPELNILINVLATLLSYKETPRFHGIKSSCPSNTAFGIISPLAALIQYSKISSPIC